MHLNALPGGDVPLLEGRIALDDIGEGIKLIGRDAAERHLHADHLHIGLALAVDALGAQHAIELLHRHLAAHEPGRRGVEVGELLLEHRNDMPRHVLVRFGVLKGADAAPLHGTTGRLLLGHAICSSSTTLIAAGGDYTQVNH